MARVDKNHLELKEQNRNSIHCIVSAKYFFFACNEEKYFQIDTYGSNDRKIQGMPSQKIQFDQETAEIFIKILKEGFKI
jgi:hypothetical protein